MFEKPAKDYRKVGTVCEIVQEGYKFHDRLLRPAMVGIAKKLEKEDRSSREYQNNLKDVPRTKLNWN